MSLGEFSVNVRWGIGQGAAFAAIASVVVTLSQVSQWHVYAAHIWLVLATYFFAGIGAGAVVGALRPFTRHLIGAMLVGIVAAVPFAIALGAVAGSTALGNIDWKSVRFLAVICGPLRIYSVEADLGAK